MAKNKKRILRLYSYPIIFLFAFIGLHYLFIILADLPADYCYFHTSKPSFLQSLFLDQMGHTEPYGFEFILFSALMVCIGLLMGILKNIKA